MIHFYRLEYSDYKSHKFYEIKAEDIYNGEVQVRYGRIGTDGQYFVYYPTDKNWKSAEKLLEEKIRKGYKLVPSTATAPKQPFTLNIAEVRDKIAELMAVASSVLYDVKHDKNYVLNNTVYKATHTFFFYPQDKNPIMLKVDYGTAILVTYEGSAFLQENLYADGINSVEFSNALDAFLDKSANMNGESIINVLK